MQFIFGCMARGGLSASALYDIYIYISSFWSATMRGTMFAAREHFVQKLLFAILVHASMLLLDTSGIEELHSFQWHLRPHHEAADFEPLLRKLRAGFYRLASEHACPLFDKVRACVIDGNGLSRHWFVTTVALAWCGSPNSRWATFVAALVDQLLVPNIAGRMVNVKCPLKSPASKSTEKGRPRKGFPCSTWFKMLGLMLQQCL